MTNPAIAPRKPNSCPICRIVPTSEDVDIRLFTPEGLDRATHDAKAYLVARGYDSPTLGRQIGTHRAHVRAWLDEQIIEGVVIAEAPVNAVSRVAPLDTAHWVDVQQAIMDVGLEAQRQVASRLDAMKDGDVIAVMKTGLTAAGARAALESRGKGLPAVDKLMQLAAGLRE
jgi:hypothetical protein